jgi:hypothetical protein
MGRRLRRDVPKSQAMLVVVHNVCGNLPVDDAFEDRPSHESHSNSSSGRHNDVLDVDS